MPQNFKCLVIDVNITCAASDRDSGDEWTKSCRDFLKLVRETKHKIVITDAIRAEQRKHPSKFAETWLRSMIAQKLVCWVDAPSDEKLRQKVEQFATTPNKLIAMLEDIHLIEAALKTDKTIISMDEAVRQCFHDITPNMKVLRVIV